MQAVMCEHEFQWGKVLREHCPKCSTTLYEQDLEKQLAAANARVVELEQENSKLASAAIEQPPYKAGLIDRMKRMEDALLEIKNGTQEAFAYDKAKAALEGKP